MDLIAANTAVAAALHAAEVEPGYTAKFSIAIMDAGVNLVAFSRMDGARVGTIDVAMKKVKDAPMRGKPTSVQTSASNDSSCRPGRPHCLRRSLGCWGRGLDPARR